MPTSKPEDCGCGQGLDEDEFAALTVASDTDEPAAGPDPRGTTVRRFRDQLLAPYGKPTGDKRRFAKGALTVGELPIGVKWQREDNAGHSASVTVGRVDKVRFGDDGVYGSGVIFDPDPEKTPRWHEDCNEAYGLLGQKVIGPSVDLDDMQYHEYVGDDEYSVEARPEIEVDKGRIRAVTLVQIPAFVEARPFALEEQDADEYATEVDDTAVLVASGVANYVERAPAVANVEWDPLHWLANTIGMDGAALYDGPEGQYFPVADVVSGELALVPAAVADAISVMAYKADSIGLDEATKQAMRFQLDHLAGLCELPPTPWTNQPAALTASVSPTGWRPARADFENPNLTQLTPLTIDGNRVYGHLAAWNDCHVGFKSCVKAPRSKTKYAHFHVGEIQTDQGPLAVGKITLGGGHADTSLNFQAAAEHYDDAGTAVAAVRVGEDKYGIWFSGVPLPGAEDKFSTLPLFPPSGDWRRIGGSMELIAVLAVNTPGFGIPRAHERAGQQLALVAAGIVGELPEYFANLSMEGRKASAKKGHALPDGSYPIETVSDLENAISAYGRAKDKEAAKRLIMRRARELKRPDLIPDGWKSGNSGGDYSADDLATAFVAAQRRERQAGVLATTLGEEFEALEALGRREAALQAAGEF